MIEVHDLTKLYGDRIAVGGVSFSVGRGEVLGFLGPNGAGKTTTMRMLTGYLPPSSGSAQVAGFDVFTQSAEVRRRIGYLPESPPLYPDMTVTSYLTFVAKLKGVPRRAVGDARERAISRTGLASVSGRLLSHLSKGYKQRVGLAQAIINDPEVLVLDEPTIGLDPRQIIEIRSLIKELSGERTVILSTHILPEVSQVCDKVVIINEGRLACEDTLANLTREGSLEEVFLRFITADTAAASGPPPIGAGA
jgi:gliding motility-associated transport system ATP-binding protein